MEDTYRSASDSITVSEGLWLERLGAFEVLESLPQTDYSAYVTAKYRNELRLWQHSFDPWSYSCSASEAFATSIGTIVE